MVYKRHLFLVLLVFTISSLACGFSIEAERMPEVVLFKDEFSDPSSGWDRVDVDEGITNYENGVYRILVNTKETNVWANPGLDFTDSIIKVEATKVAGSDNNAYGVICRYEDIKNFYFFIINSKGYYATGKVQDGKQKLLGENDMIPDEAIKTGNTTNAIQVNCIGSSLTFFVNGTQLLAVEDSAFMSGDVGLLAVTFDTPGTDIYFDNFFVLEP